MPRRLFWILLFAALALGALIAWVDSRPRWDDTGITIGTILIVTGLLGAAMPQHPWVWALAFGVWIPLIEIPPSLNFGALIALLVAFIGAYAGAVARKAFDTLTRAETGSSQ